MRSLTDSTHSKRKRALLIGAGIVVAGILAAAVYVFALNGSIFGWPHRDKAPVSTQNINYEPPTTEQLNAGQEAKKNTVEQSETNPQNKDTLGVSITAANQNNPTFQIRILIDSVVGSGSCQLIMTKGSVNVTRSAGTQALASTSTCQGFDIPVSELSPGTWNVKITVTTQSKTGTAERSVEVR